MRKDESVPYLTPREADMLALMLEGHSNSEMETTLQLRRGTISVTVHYIYKMLGLRNRSGLLKEALRRGVLTLNRNKIKAFGKIKRFNHAKSEINLDRL